MFFSKKWNPEGLHCYVTGGSTGLGLSLTLLLVKNGAHVSIVARNQQRLDQALKKMEQARVNASQKLKAYSYELDTGQESAAALQEACKAHGGHAPDAIFACAGYWKPMFFVEMTEEDFASGMTGGYWVQAWTAFAFAKMVAKQEKKGAKLVLVSSTLGYMSFLGWASYAPAKHALRGLADTLRSELILYDTDVHLFSPPTMPTPGYEVENTTKPKITKEIEDSDDGLTPDQAALAMLTGVQKGQAHITGDFITSLFRAATRGSAPGNNFIVDAVLDGIAYIATPIWRMGVDKKIVAHRAEHREHLKSVGFLD